MPRSSKIVGFSLPPATLDYIDELAKTNAMTRSEQIRDIVAAYQRRIRSEDAPRSAYNTTIASLLYEYWQRQADRSTPQTVVVGLAVLSAPDHKILIAQRSSTDPFVEDLTWSYVGGQLKSLDFAGEIKQIVTENTGLEGLIGPLISARVMPESEGRGTQVVLLYFEVRVTATAVHLNKQKYEEFKWVEPLEVFKYFTSSTDEQVTRYLTTLGRR